MSVRRVQPEEVCAIRHQVLRPHQPIEMATYPLDDEPSTYHVGAFHDGELVGVASIFNEAPGGSLADDMWRIRGMATLEHVRGEGYGEALLNAVVLFATAAGGSEAWCNARTDAAGFYRKYGFEAHEPEYELPGLGPHLRMFKSLSSDDSELPHTTDPDSDAS